jgi:hypothetical protein
MNPTGNMITFSPNVLADATQVNQNFTRLDTQDQTEDLSSQITGSTHTFTTAYNFATGSLKVYLDGLRVKPSDITVISSNSFSIYTADIEGGAEVICDYIKVF